MTVRTTTLTGADAGGYYVEHELEYYLDQGEPPGAWRGRGAAMLGLDGAVDEDDFLALMAGLDPQTRDLLGSAHTERTARGYDVTCSAPKSVSVLYAIGGDAIRAHVVDSHDAAVGAVVDWIERHAHTRYRVDGEVCVFDAEGIVAATFRQHTSRALDPQVHTHVVIANRVPAPDGRWLALDARTIKQDQQALSRLYHAGLRAELTRRLGVRWQEPANGIAEIVDIPPDLLREFSQRTGVIAERVADKIEQFHDSHGRPPTPRERWRIERDAVVKTRPWKSDAHDASLDDDWLARAADLGITPVRLVAETAGRVGPVLHIDEARAGRVASTAVAALTEVQSTWRRAELVRELAAAVPTEIGMPAAELALWIDELADAVIAARMVELSRPVAENATRRRDGRPISEGAVERRLTTPEILAQEERVLALAERRVSTGGDDHAVEGADGLAPAQHALATAVAGERTLVLAIGPAGTGKTTALKPAVEQLRREGRVVFGVAPSATAAEVLAVDSGVEADTIDKLLIEHRLDRPPDHRYDLPPGATVIVDEAAMVSTPRLAELFELAERRAWRLVLVGDPMQFSAVGRSGMFGHFVETLDAIELGRVHRFADPWEAQASLRLRRGDAAVLDEYQERGRLHGGTERQMRTAAVRAWWEATERGESACLVAPNNAAVVTLNHDAQAWRRAAGQLDRDGEALNVGPYRLHVGDVVATRRNDRSLVTDRSLMVKNRDCWTTEAIHRDGSVSVGGRTGRVRLPAEYVTQHLELAYAQTSHASQGRTVDRSILYLDAPTGAAGIYVPMTRGRQSNEAFVVLRGEETPADVMTEALARKWIDRPAVAVRAETPAPLRGDANDGHGAVAEIPQSGPAVRRLFERAAELDLAIGRARGTVDDARRKVETNARDRAQVEQRLAEQEARLAAAHAVLEQFDRPFSRRRHAMEVEGARKQVGWLPKSIADDRAELAALRGQTPIAAERAAEAIAEARRAPELQAARAEIQLQIDADARARGERTRDLPATVVDRLGPKPRDPAAAMTWIEAAGWLAQHQETWGVTEGLGARPTWSGDEPYALSYRAAHKAVERLDRALGRVPDPPHRALGLSL